ncbi:MAG TPA: S41 family peptidase [Thermodesulfobacteriota bacterium]|nr:S41 family peptidase [Thermodesulfobacteriota bacterium]
MKKNHRPWAQHLAFLGLGLILGAILSCRLLIAFAPDTIPPAAESNFRSMAEAWNTIERVYVDRSALNAKLMTYGAISGMVDALGDTGHSRFLTPEMVKQERNLTRGEIEGIGAEVQMKNGQVVIVAPIDGSPAQRAGLKPGDIILKVDDKDVSGLPLDQAVEKILGSAGTRVKLTILDPQTGKTGDIIVIRARITLHNVTWTELPRTTAVHLRIATFSKGVSKELREALLSIEKEGATGLILDLRNNPGGLYDEAISAASQFLQGGNVLLEKNALGKVRPVPVRPGGVALAIPLVVLINGGTSSGAEIVAGALQDAHRAKLVGEKTFGTGTVLEAFPLSDGSALMLAIEEWLTPAGHLIWHQGISPDVVVTLPPEGTPLLPATERGMTAEKLRESRDLQLLRGLELLTESGPTQPSQLNRLNEKYKICCDYGVNRDEPKSKSLLGYPQ